MCLVQAIASLNLRYESDEGGDKMEVCMCMHMCIRRCMIVLWKILTL